MADTRSSFHAQLQNLQDAIETMAVMVEQAIHRAVKALKDRDLALAQQVIDEDPAINQTELAIERECLRLIALQQPMAQDLRAVSTALKIITDLERMADHARDIAKIVLRMGGRPHVKPLIDIPRMAEVGQRMLRQAIDAYVRRDEAPARQLVELDDEVDHLYNQVFRELLTFMIQDPRLVQPATYLIFVGLHLERIADHATNLGEWAIYLITGQREELNP